MKSVGIVGCGAIGKALLTLVRALTGNFDRHKRIARWTLLFLEHPNQEKYGGQRILVVKVEDYVYLVPFVETENEIALKTIIPSRRAKKRYLRGGTKNG